MSTATVRSMTELRCRSLVGHELLGPVEVTFEDGVVSGIETLDAGHETFDVEVLAPGFIDWQVNGVDDLDVWRIAREGDTESFSELTARQLRRGVTSWMPTLVSAPKSDYESALVHLERWTSESGGRVLGVHLEGPFLGSAPGAHRRDAITTADPVWIRSLPDVVNVMTVAAENEGVGAVVEELTTRGVRVSIGHSRPTRREFEHAVALGASAVTHLFNAMSGLDHRQPGLAAWALLHEGLWCGLIADGVHVSPEMIALAFRLSSPRITLVTDSVAWKTQESRTEIRDGAPRLADGTLAGSSTTMLDSIATCVRAGVSWTAAIHAATANVADFLGMSDRGRIDIGRRADFTAFDDRRQLTGVWSAGDRVV
ncbi:MAG: hypothetical protein RL391_235 [Actinomycetota bacterium]|jgi:N-acetylglucosamine-6-phosphate deacetylase